MRASLYVHIPFCASKCAYCNFYSTAINKNNRQISFYLEALCKEIKDKINKYEISSIPTIYIGGGTPSFIGTEKIKILLEFILKNEFSSIIEKNAEITIEANPESLDEAFLLCCKENGITRISCGVQTFCAESRKAAGRIGSPQMVKDKLLLLSSIYKKSFSCDLISALPFQDEKALFNDIEVLLEFEPAHVSLYDLEPHRDFGIENTDKKNALWIKGRDELIKNGFEQYEVSNFALNKDFRSKHNIRYWEMKSWLGAGKSASSTIIFNSGAIRETDNNTEMLDKKTLMKDTFLMGFRYVEGPDSALFKKRFGKSIVETIPKTLVKWKDYVVTKGERTALSNEGILFLDKFLIEAFDEID